MKSTTLLLVSCIIPVAVGLGGGALGQLPVVRVFEGSEVDRRLGTSVGSADVNGDGIDDVIIAASRDASAAIEAGAVWVYSGSDGTLIHHLEGDGPYAWFGHRVAAAGDVDDDGFEDIIVGAPEQVSQGPGYARVFSGRDGSVIYNFVGDVPSHYFGMSVAGLGDINGDGRVDLAVGARWDSTGGVDAGMVRIFSGADGTILANFFGEDWHDQLGSSVASAGDVDGDGVPDIIAGAPRPIGLNTLGYVKVWSGATLGLITRIPGFGINGRFGSSVGSAGDIDGDGLADLIIGSPEEAAPGQQVSRDGVVRVLSGGTGSLLFMVHSDACCASFGSSVVGNTDFNGDGMIDFAVGAPLDGPLNEGKIWVYSGRDASVITTFAGEQMGDVLGPLAVARRTADGFPDLIIGSPGASRTFTLEGRVYVMAVTGFRPYGVGIGAANTLGITWEPRKPAAFGDLVVSGLLPGEPGYVAASLAPASQPLGPLTILVDLDPAAWTSIFPFVAPAEGTIRFDLGLWCPPVAGRNYYGQAVQFGPTTRVSHGLEVLFTR
jgi:hypothetical protein